MAGLAALALLLPLAAGGVSGPVAAPARDLALPAQSGERLGPGKFLVADRKLRDPNFAETVVLLLDYSPEGALGLVINWSTDTRLAVLLPDLEGVEERPDRVFIGGPVARNAMLLLVRSPEPPADTEFVIEDVHWSASKELLETFLAEGRSADSFRIYSGHAGWAPWQLDWEVSRGDWHVLPADPQTIFEKPSSEIWPELIKRSVVRWTGLGILSPSAR